MSQKWLKQGSSVTAKIGPFIDDTDGKTAETGLTIAQADVRLSKQGGNMAQKNESTTCTHDEIGYYDCPLDATDTGSLGSLVLMVHKSGALPVRHEFVILPANVHESLVAGSDKLDVQVSGMDANVMTAAAAASDLTTELQSGLATAASQSTIAGYLDTEVAAILAAVDTEVAAIKAKTDNLPASPAATGDCLTAAGVRAAVGLASANLDTQIGDLPTNAELATSQAAADDATLAAIAALNNLSAAGVRSALGLSSANLDTQLSAIDTVAGAIKLVTDKLDDVFEDDGGTYRFTQNALEEGPTGGSSTDLMILHTGTAQAGAAGSITLASGASSDNDAYARACVSISSGTGAGQSGICSAYNGTTKVATMVEDWAITPDSTSVVVVTPYGVVPATLDGVAEANWAALRADNQVAGSFGERVSADITHLDGDADAVTALQEFASGARFLFVDVSRVAGRNIVGAGTDDDPLRVEGT